MDLCGELDAHVSRLSRMTRFLILLASVVTITSVSWAGITITNPVNGQTELAGQLEQADGDISNHPLSPITVHESWSNYGFPGGFRSRQADYDSPQVTTTYWFGNAWEIKYPRGQWSLYVYNKNNASENAGAGGPVE